MSVAMLGDQRLGPRLDREALEIELVDRAAEAVGIVEHDHAALGRLAPEQDSGFDRPGRSARRSTDRCAASARRPRPCRPVRPWTLADFSVAKKSCAVLVLPLGQEAGMDVTGCRPERRTKSDGVT